MAKVGWGIIGCGDVTEVKSGPAFQSARGAELVAVMRRDAEKAKDYAKRHGVARWYTTVEDLLADPNVTAVYIATPPGSRLEIAKKVAASGKPCYLEKPMARSLTESLQVAEPFKQAGSPLFVAYYRRAYPRFARLRELLTSGRLGVITGVHYRLQKPAVKEQVGWRFEVSASGGGLFVDIGSHVLDLLDFLVGPLRNLHGVATRASGASATAPEDGVALSFECAEQAIGSATWSFNAPESCDLLEILTATAKVTVPELMNGSRISVAYADGTAAETWDIPPPAPAVQEPLVQSVTDAILAKKPELCPSRSDSALRAAGYIDQALEGFYGGRGDAFWERPESWTVNKRLKEA
ncbi:unnamed protein product [Symbiodinium natans]|uniref:Oxidoreductase n=1 Tax=Symbiodinium natans TaxID=878477 RepID=A0A812P0G3_9DINO|nr:unnamed protein product [Symbiodinium natans]